MVTCKSVGEGPNRVKIKEGRKVRRLFWEAR